MSLKTDSNWKYNFGQGWSRVHVEVKNDGCHIQLVKESFWKKIANIFFRTFHIHIEFKPQIKERVFTYLKEKDELQNKISTVRDTIEIFEKQGISPDQMLEILVQMEEVDQKNYLESHLNVPEKAPNPISVEGSTLAQDVDEPKVNEESPSQESSTHTSLLQSNDDPENILDSENIFANSEFLDFLEGKDEIDLFFDSIKKKEGQYDQEITSFLDALSRQKLKDEKTDKTITHWVDQVISLSSGSSQLSITAEEKLKELLDMGKDLDFQELFSVLSAGYRLAHLHKQEEVIENEEDLVSIFEEQLYNLIDLHFDQFKMSNYNEFSLLENPPYFDKDKASKIPSFISPATKLYRRDRAASNIETFMKYTGYALIAIVKISDVITTTIPMYQRLSEWYNSPSHDDPLVPPVVPPENVSKAPEPTTLDKVEKIFAEIQEVRDEGRMIGASAQETSVEEDIVFTPVRHRTNPTPEQEKEEIQLRNFAAFLESPPIPINNRLFVHALLDYSGKDTGYEGYISSAVMDYRLQLLRAKINSLRNNPSCSEAEKIAACQSQFSQSEFSSELAEVANLQVFENLAKFLETAQQVHHTFLNSPLDVFQKKIKEEMESLSLGESFFFPGSWPGHAIAYEVIKQADGAYTFRVYNTGMGINAYYTRATLNGQNHYIQFTEIVDIPQENIQNLAFLYSLRVLTETKLGEAKEKIDKDLYITILSFLNGKMSSQVYPIETLRKAQMSGICSYLSLVAVFNQYFDDQKSAVRFEFETRLKALLDYHTMNHENYGNEEVRRMVQEGVAGLAESIESLHKQEIITPSELALSMTKLSVISRSLATAQADYEKKLIRSYPLVRLENTIPIEHPHNMEAQKTGEEVDSLPRYLTETSTYWQPSASKIVNDLQYYHNMIRTINNIGDAASAIEEVKTLVQKLPLEDDLFWYQLTKDEVESVLQALSSLDMEYARSFISNASSGERASQVKPEEYITQLKILTLADKISRLHASSLGIELPNLIQKSFQEILDNKSSLFFALEPKWEMEFIKLRDYWQKAENIPKMEGNPYFFGFDRSPAGYGGFALSVSSNMRDYQLMGEHAWSEIEWARKWVNRPEVKQKIVRNYPELADKNDIILAIAALSNQFYPSFDKRIVDPSILPPTFFRLREVSFLTDLLLAENFHHLSKHTLNFSLGLSYTYYLYNDNVWCLSRKLFGEVKSFDDKPKEPLSFKSKIWEPHTKSLMVGPAGVLQDYHIKQSITLVEEKLEELFVDKILNDLVWYGQDKQVEKYERRRVLANQLINEDIIRKHPDLKLNLQDMRELLAIASNKEEQSKEAFGYFVRNPQRLEDVVFQHIFNLLIFEPGMLLQEFQKNPAESTLFADQIANFCRRQYELSNEIGNLEAALFFLEVNQRFIDYLSLYKKELPASFPKDYHLPFMDSRKEIQFHLKNTHLTPELKARFNGALALSHLATEKFSAEEMSDLIQGVIGARLEHFPHKIGDQKQRVAQRDILYAKRAEVERLLSGPSQNLILNRIYHHFKKDAPDLVWQGSPKFPYYSTDDGKVIINVLMGKIYLAEGGLIPLPEDIMTNSVVSDIFGKTKKVLASNYKYNTYQLSDHTGSLYRIKKNDDGLITIKRNIDGHWYSLTNTLELSLPALTNHHHIWIKGQGDNAESDESGFTIYFSDPKTNQLVYRAAPLEKSSKKLTIHQLDEAQKDSTLVVGNISEAPGLDFLKKFEDVGEIIVLIDRTTGAPKRIELPRFHLQFEIKKESDLWFAHSSQFPGYVLAKKQGIPQLGDVTNYLVLRKRESLNKRIILMAQQSYEEVNSRLITETNPIRKDKDARVSSQKYLVFNLNPKTRQLQAKTDEGKLYLAMVYLWKHQYKESADLLSSYRPLISPKTTQEKNIRKAELVVLQKIDDLLTTNKDSHPQAAALRLKVKALQLAHQANFPDFFCDTPLVGTESYVSYLDSLEYAENVRLPLEEEILIIKHLVHEIASEGKTSTDIAVDLLPDVVLDRIKLLEPRSYGILQALHAPQRKMPSEVLPIKPIALKQREKSLGNSFKRKYELFSKEPIPNDSTILRGNLFCSFEGTLEIVKNADIVEKSQLRNLITKITGMEVPEDSTREELIHLLGSVFSLMQYSQISELQEPAAIFYAHIKLFLDAKVIESQEPRKAQNTGLLNTFASTLAHVVSRAINSLSVALSPSAAPPPTEAETVPDIYKTCVALVNQPELSEPILEHPETFIRLISPSENKAAKVSQTNNELKELFSISMNDGVAERKRKEMISKLDEYGKSSSGLRPIYEITHLDELRNVKFNCAQAAYLEQKKLKEARAAIEDLANKAFDDPVKQDIKKSRLLAGKEEHIDLEEAVQLFLRRDAELFYKRNSALSEQDIITLNDLIQRYLIQETHKQHLNLVSEKAEQVEKAIAAKEPEANIREFIQEFVSAVSKKREYSISEHPEYLVFEYYNEFLLRKDQIEDLDLLNIKNGKIGNPQYLGIVLEKIMGSGKTAILIPIVSMMDADGEHLVLMVMLEELVPSISKELQSKLGTSFKKDLQVLSFTRDSLFDVSRLQMIHEILCRARDERKAVLMSSNSIHSLYLKFMEKLREYAEVQNSQSFWYSFGLKVSGVELEKEIALFRDIFKVLRGARATFDEVHVLLDVLKSFHFTVGEPKAIDSIYINTISDLYLFLAQDSEIRSAIKLPFMVSASRTPFTPENYEQIIKPIIIQRIVKGDYETSDSEFELFLKGLTVEQREFVKKYLADQIDSATFDFIESQPNPKIQDALAILKEEISLLLPLTAKKNLKEHYGSNFESEKVEKDKRQDRLAIPWHKGKANLGSQFGTDTEIINYTIQKHLEEGLSEEIIRDEVERIYTAVLLEKEKKPNKKIPDCTNYPSFLKLTNGDKSIRLLAIQEEDIKKITAYVNKNPQLQMELIKRHVLPQIKVYSTQMNADAQVFGFLFEIIRTLTGTPWNAETYPKIIQALFTSTTDAQTLHLMWENSPNKVNVIKTPSLMDEKGVQNILDQIYIRDGHRGAMIDNAGFFRGIKNQVVAEKILRLDCWKETSIKGVPFYDDEGYLMVASLVGNKLKIESLSSSSFSKEELAPYWDQQHTTGSNIQVGAMLSAVETVGRHSLLFEVFQAAWRMRGLDKGQTVAFIVTEEESIAIRATLEKMTGQKIEGELEKKHLLLYTLYAQAQRQGDENYRSFKAKMQAILLEKVFSTFLDPKVTVPEMAEIFNVARSLFETDQKQRPYELYGKGTVKDVREKIVDNDLNEFLKSPAMQAFRTNPVLLRNHNPRNIEKQMRELAAQEMANLPQIITTTQLYGKERSVQQQTQKQTSKETQKEESKAKEIQRQTRYEGAFSKKPREVIDFLPSNPFEKNALNPGPANHIIGIHRDIWLKKSPPLLPMSEICNSYPDGKPVAKFFDQNLFCSLNLCPVDKPTDDMHSYTPFGLYQKSFTQLLVMEDKSTGEIKAMLVDSNDSKIYNNMLLKDAKKPIKGNRDVRLALYHLDVGMHTQGSDRIDAAKLEANPQFQKLKAQAKFLRGDTDYTDKEKVVLKKWLSETDSKQMHAFFEEQILSFKETSYESFSGSALDRVFQELMV